ncbi:hypothetical protein BGZ58_008564 [Dissophora ornata]|nr:hypothetical protein BGZ58_008564 [Dissophora ornata]
MLARTGLKYPSKLHCKKVASNLSKHARHNAIILVKGNAAQLRDNTDTDLPFRQESNFFYLSGVQDPDCYFIYDFSHSKSYLIAPDLDPAKAIWTGPDMTDSQLLKAFDVDHVVRYSGMLKLLKNKLKPKKIHGWNHPEKVLPLEDKAEEHELAHYISHRLICYKSKSPASVDGGEHCPPGHRHHGYRPHHYGPYGDHHGHRSGHHHDHHHGHHGHHHHHHHGHHGDKHKHKHKHGKHHCDDDPKEPEDSDEVTLLEAMILARINKTPIEIALSRESTRITSDAHRVTMQSIRPGMFEYQLGALFQYECDRQGGKPTYLSIVGSGVNGAYLHYTKNDRQIKDGDLVVLDAACEVDCYTSDVTRTFPANGRFSPEQLEIYNLVREMQSSVISLMEKGIEWREMFVLSQKIGIRGLKRLGIFTGDENDLFESNIIRVFYPHGLGHLLGLNVHDDGLGLAVQRPEALMGSATLPVEFHPITTNNNKQNNATAAATISEQLAFDLPPPSSRRSKAKGASVYATPATRLQPGMLLTVEPGIYFNPAQVESALQNPDLAQYLDEPTLRRYMSVGGVRIEDVMLMLPNGTVSNITTITSDPHEIEQIVQEGQRLHRESQQMGQDVGSGKEKYSKEKQQTTTTPAASDKNASKLPQGAKKRLGVFKKLMRAIRGLF